MKTSQRLQSLTFVVALICLAPAGRGATASEPGVPPDEELTIGQEMFDDLKAKGEIIESSPLYDVLLPVIEPIMKAAQPMYPHPFKVYLVHEPQPNAFATPGGYIYVVDALLYFAKNKEELAGTLSHEVSHTIHHDGVELAKKQAAIERREIGGAILIGPTGAHILALALIGKLHSLTYSREAESRADITGSDICATAGINPWGLVWLFQDFKSARKQELPQLLSNHPNDLNRIAALETHFKGDPQTFGHFNPDSQSATPLNVPKKAPVVFLR